MLRRVTKRSACGSTPGGGAVGRSGACLSTGGRVHRVLPAGVVCGTARQRGALSVAAAPFIPVWEFQGAFLCVLFGEKVVNKNEGSGFVI